MNKNIILDHANSEMVKAFKRIEKTGNSFMITGKAGTGKSTLLTIIRQDIKKNVVVVAPTGIAALNAGGVTIHSFFELPIRPLMPNDPEIKVFPKDSEKSEIIREMNTLIIDEISMCRSDVLDAIDISLRRNLKKPDHQFGGKQVIMIGDMYQLPPVINSKTSDYTIMKKFYNSAYFFDSKVLEAINIDVIELQKVYRQKDLSFIDLLDKVRIGNFTLNDLAALNMRYDPNVKAPQEPFSITLVTTNNNAEQINKYHLDKLDKPSQIFEAEIEGEFEQHLCPTEIMLELKVNSQIMFVKNDRHKQWVNGSIGIVHELDDNKIKVVLENGEICNVKMETWQKIEYGYNETSNRITENVRGTFIQFPLKLAWAITIHKSQGLTFDKVRIDLGRGAFASGQTYVALSRSRTLNGIKLLTKIKPTDVIVDKNIRDYAKKLEDITFPWDKIEPRKTNKNSPDYPSIVVDSECLSNPGKTIIRVLDTKSRKVLHRQEFEYATNNVAEFLAVFYGIAYLQMKKLKMPVYTKSETAIKWIKNKKCKSSLQISEKTKAVTREVQRAENYLHKYGGDKVVRKWESKKWGVLGGK